MLLNLPWTIVSLILYNIIAFTGSADETGDYASTFGTQLFSMGLISGGTWTFTIGDLVLLVAFLALFVEIIKSARTSDITLIDHALSVIVFIICLIEFIMVPFAATSLFFFIMITALIDVIAGFSVSLTAARRDMGIGG
jgi:hypothetical protein